MHGGSEHFVEFLRSTSLNSAVADDHLTSILSVPIASRFYPAGTFLVEDGEPGREVQFISSGWALSYKSMPDGQRVVLDFLQRGDLINYNSVGGQAYSFVECASDVSTFEISTSGVRLAAISPFLAGSIMSRIARNHSIAVEHLANISRRAPLNRLAHLFMEITHRHERSSQRPLDRYQLPFTQRDIADALGLSAIHVNRLLRLLREDGLLNLHRGTVEILDRRALTTIAFFDPAYLSCAE